MYHFLGYRVHALLAARRRFNAPSNLARLERDALCRLLRLPVSAMLIRGQRE